MEGVLIERAGPQEDATIRGLLQRAGLPFEDICLERGAYALARKNSHALGCVGIETHGEYGLLRSLAVSRCYQGSRLGSSLMEWAIGEAEAMRLKEVYLITTQPRGLFFRAGFEGVVRSDVPSSIRASTQYSGVCPASATVMRRTLSQ